LEDLETGLLAFLARVSGQVVLGLAQLPGEQNAWLQGLVRVRLHLKERKVKARLRLAGHDDRLTSFPCVRLDGDLGFVLYHVPAGQQLVLGEEERCAAGLPVNEDERRALLEQRPQLVEG